MNFSGTSDIVRRLKTFSFTSYPNCVKIVRIPSFSGPHFLAFGLQMYSDKFFNIYFYEQMFF